MENLLNEPVEPKLPIGSETTPDELSTPWPIPDLDALAPDLDAMIEAGKEAEARAIEAANTPFDFAALESAEQETAAPFDLDSAKRARRAELRRQTEARDSYAPDATSDVYDGPLDDEGQRLPSCLRRWEAARGAQAGESQNLPPVDFSSLGVFADDLLVQVDETRAAFFRRGLPAAIVAPGTLCEFELASGAVVIERYFGPMPAPEKWEQVDARLAPMGATFRVIGVAVAIVERSPERKH